MDVMERWGSHPTAPFIKNETQTNNHMKNRSFGLAFLTVLALWSSCTRNDPLPVGVRQLHLPKTVTLPVGGGMQFSPTTVPAEVTRPYTLVWSSDNEEVATVDQQGNVTVLSVGVANVRTQVYEDGNPQSMAAATRIICEDYTLTLEETYGKMPVGGTLTIPQPVVTPEGAPYTLVWSSSDPAIAQVSQKGVITGMEQGQAVISVHVQQRPSASAIFTVDVGLADANPGGSLPDIPDGGDW